jgi:hypothetical protein
MANVVPYAFKQGILKGQHDLSALNAYYLALFTTATPYAENRFCLYFCCKLIKLVQVELAYTTDGKTCGQGVVAQTGDYTTVDFTTDPTWTTSTITARTGVLYKYVAPGGTTTNQYLVAILDFGARHYFYVW